ncbi:unnamed protein product [Paramecium pentaurelia]|uniref:Uncharacterized protein n=1 Tax=Paramecium pentaurelia TaxID=43138 RepID=A0A8S1W4D7_9CILI|nr:unnamed protein product [Paramecium pentaurelia]
MEYIKKKAQPYLIFGLIEQKINQNAVFRYKDPLIKIFQQLQFKNSQKLALLILEVFYKKQSLIKNLQKDYQKALTEMVMRQLRQYYGL